MSKDVFEFIIYMIHACARKWHQSPAEVYRRLSDGDRVMNYLISNYDVLHTQGTGFVVADIEELIEISDNCRDNLDLLQELKSSNEAVDEKVLEAIYQESLEERLVGSLTDKFGIDYQSAMRVYYSSKLAEKIHEGRYGVQYLDYKVLADILEETEPELIQDVR